MKFKTSFFIALAIAILYVMLPVASISYLILFIFFLPAAFAVFAMYKSVTE